MDPHWARLVDFTRANDSVITWSEATNLHIPPDRLQAWQRSGRVRRVAPQTYALAGVPDTWHQRVRIATASGAGWASHRTAAALEQLNGFDGRIIEVITERGRRRKRSGWKVHESRTLRGVDLSVADGLPATSIVRTILDLPAVAHPFLVAKALDDACRRSPHMLGAIVRRHQELPRRGRRGAVLMSAMLSERLGEDIRWWVECDGLDSHFGKAAHEWDRMRRRRLKRLGWDGIELTYDDVTKRPEACGLDLRDLYHDRAATQRARHG